MDPKLKNTLHHDTEEALDVATKMDRFFETKQVHSVLLVLILINAISAGLSTFPNIFLSFGKGLRALETTILSIFIIELGSRLIVTQRQFFRNYWNVFDLIVVLASLFPSGNEFSILRILRVLHCMSLLDLLPKTKHVIDGFIKALPGIVNVIFLEFVFVYTFSVMAYHLYGQTVPEKFGHVGLAMYYLVGILGTLDWVVLTYEIGEQAPHSWIFLLVYIIIAGYILLNFVIGTIVNAMTEAGQEDNQKKGLNVSDLRHTEILKALSTLEAVLKTTRQEMLEKQKKP